MLLFIDFITDEVEEAPEIFRGGIAGVDNETGVLFRDLRSANGSAFQAAFFNQHGGEISLRAAESAAGGREIKRLLVAPALVQVFHTGSYLFSVSGRKAGRQYGKKTADQVKKGDILAYVHAADETKLDDAVENVKNAYIMTRKHVKKTSPVLEIL